MCGLTSASLNADRPTILTLAHHSAALQLSSPNNCVFLCTSGTTLLLLPLPSFSSFICSRCFISFRLFRLWKPCDCRVYKLQHDFLEGYNVLLNDSIKRKRITSDQTCGSAAGVIFLLFLKEHHRMLLYSLLWRPYNNVVVENHFHSRCFCFTAHIVATAATLTTAAHHSSILL